jgi:peptidoglycan/LPS O-acetylase OafA/YrhL
VSEVNDVATGHEDPEAHRAGARLEHQPALDGLRGVAVLLVLIYHHDLISARPGGLRGGLLGVDVFFVLSGYLITSLLLVEHASTGRVAIGSFWARRARRLLPAVLLLLSGVALYSVTIAGSTELAAIRGSALATLLYVQNWHLVLRQFRPGSVLDHTWSLSVEEQWYLVWPLLLALLLSWKRARLPRVFAIVIGLATASAIWTYVLDVRGSRWLHIYYGTDTRAQELLIGAGLAVLLRHHVAASRRTRTAIEVIGCGGCLAVGGVVLRAPGHSFFATGGYAIFAISVAAVIAASVQTSSRIVRPALSATPLRAVGLISYGLYLYHFPMFLWLSPQRTHVSGAMLLVIRLAASIAAATASYVLVERPIRRGAVKGVTLLVAAPVAIAAVLAVTIVTTRVVSPIPPAPLLASSTVANYERAADAPGHRVLVVGHALAFQLEFFRGVAKTIGLNAAPIGFVDCSFISGNISVSDVGSAREAPHCQDLLPALRTLDRAFRPDAVVLMPDGPELYDRRVGPYLFQVGTDTWTVYARAQLDASVEALSGAPGSGRTPVLIANVPCNAAPPDGTVFDAVAHDRDRRDAVNRFLTAYTETHRPKVMLGDLDRVLCRDGTAIRSTGGRQIVDARGTLTADGARYVWEWMARQFAAQ